MRVFVVAGSPAARRPWGLNPGPGDYVIAADLGAHHALAWSWPVDLLVGDLDSLPADDAAALNAAGTRTVRVPAAKDETDTELALAQAWRSPQRSGRSEIIVCGATGGRTDHLLANVFLLARPELASRGRAAGGRRGNDPAAAGGRRGGAIGIEGAAGDLVSLLPLGQDALGVSTEGLLYPLHAETLHLGQARGVSNVLTGPRGKVSLQRGQLLVIQNRME